MGRGWVKILLVLFHLSNFFTLVTFLGSQGLLQSPSYKKLVLCCLVIRGCTTPQSCCLLPAAGFTLSFSGFWALFLGSVAGRKGCLFSLFLIFSITKNYPRTSKGMCHSPHSTLVPARIGWAGLKGGHPLLPSSLLSSQM